MKKLKEKVNGITLIALVITIIILLILAGITILSLSGENGLITRAKQARQAQIESEMKEQLTLALQDLQIEKLGDVTLDDVTQEWIDAKINNYVCTVKDDLSISDKKIIMEKEGIICKFLVDGNLNIIEIEDDGNGAVLEYEVLSRDGDNVNILITITDKENGLQQVEFPDGNIIYCNGNEDVAKDYEVQLGVEYKVRITSKGGQVKEETILISDYYHKITKNFGEGISIDNVAVKAAYNKPYRATIIAGNEYIIDTISVTMGGEAVTVDETTGVIDIEKVTGDIEITATAKKLEIETTTPIINTSSTETSSLGSNTQTRGTTLYINFKATIEGIDCIIEPEVPYSVKNNGKYKFTVSGIYQDKTVTKEIEVIVDQYQSAQGLVQYDAGDWTKEEIEKLQSSKIYDLNASHTKNSTFKLNDDSGLNFTFGGFTYKGDTANESNISSGAVITSRNKSVSPESGGGTAQYDGWQILSTEIKTDDEGNTIKEADGTDRVYVKTIIHAGTPENFVYYTVNAGDCARAEYLLSSGERCTTYNQLSDGTKINVRDWDMYKDQGQLDLIDGARCYIYPTQENADTKDYLATGANFFNAMARTFEGYNGLYAHNKSGGGTWGNANCWGIRPVIVMKEGVYIASGKGTEAEPYVLAKE